MTTYRHVYQQFLYTELLRLYEAYDSLPGLTTATLLASALLPRARQTPMAQDEVRMALYDWVTTRE